MSGPGDWKLLYLLSVYFLKRAGLINSGLIFSFEAQG